MLADKLEAIDAVFYPSPIQNQAFADGCEKQVMNNNAQRPSMYVAWVVQDQKLVK